MTAATARLHIGEEIRPAAVAAASRWLAGGRRVPEPSQVGVLRERLRRRADPLACVLVREEALALLAAVAALPSLEELDYPADLLQGLGLAADAAALVALVAALQVPEGDEAERAALLGVAFEEAGLARGALDPWVGPEQLPEDTPEAPRIANELRWLRMAGVLANPWAAWARLRGLTAPTSGARLIYTVGVPGGERTDLAALGIEVDVTLTMDDVSSARGAQARRRLAVERVSGALAAGARVSWLANSTTRDSRRAVIGVARAARAQVEAVVFDEPPASLLARQEGLGWPVAERLIARALQVLEAPRPYEAERVHVVRGGTVVETWEAGIWDGWAGVDVAAPAAEGVESP